ncbi:MAG TPA: malectin domain-containing carbohydrate-binding protein [Candidatus Didemnitutus sp.]|jgi:fibronectin type 3 domain-containing protein
MKSIAPLSMFLSRLRTAAPLFVTLFLFAFTVTARAQSPVLRIDAGGGAVSPFAADTDFNSGNQFSSTATINLSGVTNAAPMAVYQSVRWNTSFNYTLPGLTPGTAYVVRLHFVELSFTTVGARTFNVAINGANVLSNFDIFAAVGQNHALEREFNATANGSGQIVLAFTHGTADNPSIAGIEVWTTSAPTVPPAPTGVTATSGSGSVGLSWTASSGATSYIIYRSTSSNGEGTTAYASNVTATGYTDSAVTIGTTYYYKIAAVNSAGTSAQSAEVHAAPASTPPNTAVLQIDAGGGIVTPFAADKDFDSGNQFTSTATISVSGVTNAAPAAVYQSVRWNTSFNYTLPGLTPGASYVVRLHFVELSFTASGSRTFNVAINGTSVLSNFDIFAAVGQNHALEREFNATANSSGQIVVAFTHGTADNPSVAGLEVWTPASVTVPSTPTGVTATPSSSSVALSWTASSGATSYNVFRSTTSNGEGTTAYASNITTVSFTDTAVTTGTTYYYKVAAVNSAGMSAQSSEVHAAPTATAPSTPTGVTATSNSNSIGLSWSASAGATSYNIYRSTSSNGEGTSAYVSNVTTTSYTDSAVAVGTTYYYKVAAVNSAGMSAQSAEVHGSPTGSSVPPNTAVLQIDAGGGAVSPFVADVDFDSGTAFSSGSAINVAGVTNAAPMAVYQSVRWNASFNYTLPGLTAGTSYVVRLHFVELSFTTAGARAFNVALNGTSVLSNFDIFAAAGQNHALEREFNATANSSGQIVVAFTKGTADNPAVAGIEVWTQPTIPAAPTGLSAVGSTSQVALSWAGSTGASTYNVYRGTSANGESGTPIATGITTLNLTDTAVVNGNTYYYKVAAVNSAGVSAMSNEASATPRVVVPPTPANPAAMAEFGDVSVTWNASQGATTYNVYRATSAGGEGATPYVSGVTSTSYIDNSVTAGTTYYYKVAAVNSAGTSGQSTEVSAAPLSAAGQGASMPYTRYRAADSAVATYGGGAMLKTSPQFARLNLASQASEQGYVELSATGSYVQWTVAQNNQAGVTMRFTLPDTADGVGQSGSVDCYVNNVKVQTVNLTSYYAWQYFGGGGDPSDTPVSGDVPAFAFDEVHWLLGTAMNAGDKIKIQSTGGPVVGVDFLEIEQVPGAVAQPTGSVSVTSYGASSGSSDNLAAFNSAVAAAVASSSKTLYIPAGTYKLSSMWVIGSTSSPISQLTITGAGIWYTNIQFTNSAVAGGGCSIRLSATGTMDFSNMYLNSNLRSRYNENAIYKCFMDNFGVNSHFHDLWEDHFECGFWVADYAYNPCQIASGLVIQNCRIRDNLADGVNFCNGTHDSIVENCSIRNGGDDGLAVWPNNYNGAPMAVNDTFTHNTIEFIWRSSGIAFYGGSGHVASYDLVEDTFMSAGFRTNTTFPGYHFENNTGITISNSTMVDCGTSYDAWAGELGAVDLEASNTSITNFTFTNVNVVNAQRDGYSFGFSGGFSGIQLNSCTVNGTGLDGITSSKYTQAHLGAGICTYSAGAATFTSFSYANCAGGEVFNQGGFVLTFR